MTPADLTKPFSESCCDGGAVCNVQSAQPCGCDPGANHKCDQHKYQLSRSELKDIAYLLDDLWDFVDNYSDVNDGDDGQPVANTAMRLSSRIEDVSLILTKVLDIKNYVE